MSDIISIDELKIGQTISFKTYNQYDNVEWRGIIVGFGTYSLVQKLEDLLPYYQNVKKTQSNMADISELSYIIFDMYENISDDIKNKRIFAKEWIDQSTLKLIDTNENLEKHKQLHDRNKLNLFSFTPTPWISSILLA